MTSAKTAVLCFSSCRSKTNAVVFGAQIGAALNDSNNSLAVISAVAFLLSGPDWILTS